MKGVFNTTTKNYVEIPFNIKNSGYVKYNNKLYSASDYIYSLLEIRTDTNIV